MIPQRTSNLKDQVDSFQENKLCTLYPRWNILNKESLNILIKLALNVKLKHFEIFEISSEGIIIFLLVVHVILKANWLNFFFNLYFQRMTLATS